MNKRGNGSMGRVIVDMVVANNRDMIKAEDREIRPDQIRRLVIRSVADSGSVQLILPAGFVKQLGLREIGKVGTRYADNRRARRSLVGNVYVELLGRAGVFQAIVEPDRDSALIGAIVLETLDLLIDCTQQTLVPRDPKTIIAEVE